MKCLLNNYSSLAIINLSQINKLNISNENDKSAPLLVKLVNYHIQDFKQHDM